MERLQTLIEKLQEQILNKASEDHMLITTQLIYTELLSKIRPFENKKSSGPYVQTAFPFHQIKLPNSYLYQKPEVKEENIGEKTVEVLEVDEAEIEEELNLIKKNADLKNSMSTNVREEVIASTNNSLQNKLHEQLTAVRVVTSPEEPPLSLNESLRENKTEISEKLFDTPIRDLKKAISINERYVFINELFNGDEAMYERSIKTINGFSIYPEAEYWIRRELKLKLGWKDVQVVRDFDQLVRRRFL